MKKKIIAALGALSIAGVIGFTTFQSGIVNAEPKLTRADIRNQVTSQYPGTIRELELERAANVYEVEVVVDGKEYELKIDGDTGDVLKLEEKTIPARAVTGNEKVVADQKTEDTPKNNGDKEKTNTVAANNSGSSSKPEDTTQAPVKNSDDTNKNVTPKQTVISHEEAKRIALNNFKGTIVELELDDDDDDNRYYYEIKMVNGNREAEIEIDAYTGNVIVLEIETDDDRYDDNSDDD